MSRYGMLLAGLILLLSSCKSDDPAPAGDTAGKGGNATLQITPRHHGRQIDSCTIYVKYNAVNPPADGRYDDSLKCVPVSGIPVATFSGLRKGKYYLYGFGWDPTLSPPQHVKGGYAYHLVNETVQSVDLAVSEN